MGIDADGIAFLRSAQDDGVDFSATCTIGRQAMWTAEASTSATAQQFADDFFRSLGADTVDSLDFSDYEGATLLHDLNSPAALVAPRSYTAVVDGGTLEHVFHVPNALRSIASLVAPGGHLLLINPADGHCGHGFYQFSPEFYYRTLSGPGGFTVKQCYFKEFGRTKWFQVPDPQVVGRRIELRSRAGGAYLYVVAQRSEQPLAAEREHVPQQSDYVARWTSETSRSNFLSRGASPWLRRISSRVPRRVRRSIRAALWTVRRPNTAESYDIPARSFAGAEAPRDGSE